MALDPNPNAVGLHSRYSMSRIIPDPEVDSKMALNLLLEEGDKLKEKGILFPCSDAFVGFVSKFRRELEEHFEMMLSPGNLSGELVSKRYQYEEALRLGVPVPAFLCPSGLEELEAVKNDLEYPVFIKPFLSHVFRSKLHRKGFVANGPEELSDVFKQLSTFDLQVMVQSFVPGPVTNLFEVEAYMGKKGILLASLVRQKIRQLPEDFGLGTMYRSVHNNEVSSLGKEFLQLLRYGGIANIEFKLDERDGKFKLIELNPRYSLQNIQATDAGLNLPLIQYLDLTSQPIPILSDYADGVIWLDASRDIVAYRSQNPIHKIHPMEYMRSWLEADCFAYFASDDPMPAVVRFSSLKEAISDASAQLGKMRVRQKTS